jgi:hypothetical protein
MKIQLAGHSLELKAPRIIYLHWNSVAARTLGSRCCFVGTLSLLWNLRDGIERKLLVATKNYFKLTVLELYKMPY